MESGIRNLPEASRLLEREGGRFAAAAVAGWRCCAWRLQARSLPLTLSPLLLCCPAAVHPRRLRGQVHHRQGPAQRPARPQDPPRGEAAARRAAVVQGVRGCPAATASLCPTFALNSPSSSPLLPLLPPSQHRSWTCWLSGACPSERGPAGSRRPCARARAQLTTPELHSFGKLSALLLPLLSFRSKNSGSPHRASCETSRTTAEQLRQQFKPHSGCLELAVRAAPDCCVRTTTLSFAVTTSALCMFALSAVAIKRPPNV